MPDVRELKAHLQSQRQYLQSLMENRLRRRYEMLLHYHRLTETIKKYAAKLETLSPYRILSRGYTYIEQNGSFIPTASALDKSQPFFVTFADGRIKARAEE